MRLVFYLGAFNNLRGKGGNSTPLSHKVMIKVNT